jgi:hypothetical protein
MACLPTTAARCAMINTGQKTGPANIKQFCFSILCNI